MTDNMKKFLEAVSDDQEFIGKLTKAETLEALIALAAEKGFTLTAEDLKKPETAEGALSDDELDAVAGGDECYCALGGGGLENESTLDGVCACVVYGQGNSLTLSDGSTSIRCICGGGGYGWVENCP